MSSSGGIDSTLLGDSYGTPGMRAVFADEARIRAMLAFEAALAAAEADAGIVPPAIAAEIAEASRTLVPDIAALGRATALAGNPAIPLVKALIAAVGPDAAGYVHFGATSQDVIDTGLMLQIGDGLDLILSDLDATATAAACLAERHARTPMIGRTFLQHAVPIPFGLKAATWLGLAARAVANLKALRATGLFVQLGGAAGSLSTLGAKGPEVADRLAARLKLNAPEMPWHSARDRMAAIGAAVAIVAGAMAKIAGDVGLLMQTDTAEAFEPSAPGKGGSSTMPHKRNPVGATLAVAAATQGEARLPVLVAAMRQEHERGLGLWHAEWGAIAELFVLTAGAVHHVRTILEGLTIDADRMRANLDATKGLVFAEAVTLALAPGIGREAAHHRLEAASRAAAASGRPLRETLAGDTVVTGVLSPAELDRLFDPATHFAGADIFIARALDAWRRAKAE